MVNRLINATSFTGNGLRDWLVQRISSVVIALYVIFLIAYFLFHSGLDYFTWQDLFASTWMRVFSILALLSLFAHAWIGIWTVVTDYVKPAYLRLAVQVIVIIALIAYLAWGVQILWGI